MFIYASTFARDWKFKAVDVALATSAAPTYFQLAELGGHVYADGRLFSVTISSQQQFVDQLVRHRLDAEYVRIDHEPSQEQARDLGLDTANETARRTLKALAEKAVTDVLGSQLSRFLDHSPQLKIARAPTPPAPFYRPRSAWVR